MKQVVDLQNQDQHLLNAVELLARRVRELPPDPTAALIESRVLLVGGFVRDALLGVRSKDVDVEVYGVAPERLESLLEQLFFDRVNTVGRSFGILKVRLGDGAELDVSIPRRESKMGRGHTGFVVESDPWMTIEEAARRRDFTVNALYADPLTGELFDFFDGVYDLGRRVLRVVDERTFQDDSLRVYRAVQFAARFAFRIEERSFQLMREMVERGDLDALSKERITEEIKKLVSKSSRPSIGFELMRDLGIIERNYPELHALIGVPQEPEWHPEGDVWIHSMMVLDQAARLIQQPERGLNEEECLQGLLGALCHDLGKPATTEMGEKDGVPRIRSIGHEEAGEEPTRQLFSRWTFSAAIEQVAVVCAMQHLKPGMFFFQMRGGKIDQKIYTNSVRKLLRRIAPTSWRVLLTVSEADFRGRGVPGVQTAPYEAGTLFAQAVQAEQLDVAPRRDLVQGRDLVALGLAPGPSFGRVISQIEVLRDAGEISTHEEAIEVVRRWMTEL